jgi:hypothetical protein
MIHIKGLNPLFSAPIGEEPRIWKGMSLHSVAFNSKKEPYWLDRWIHVANLLSGLGHDYKNYEYINE